MSCKRSCIMTRFDNIISGDLTADALSFSFNLSMDTTEQVLSHSRVAGLVDFGCAFIWQAPCG